jgi:DNA-binding HxlR family transcriptional regulator
MKSEARPGTPVRGSRTGRPIMAALDLLGRRGTLRVLWELRGGEPFTFRALAAAAELPPATLNTRLSELRALALVSAEQGYALTALGADLIAALHPLDAWSKRWARQVEARGSAREQKVGPRRGER